MNFATIIADLPSERTIEFGSAEENEEFMLHQGINQEMRQLRKGSFQSALAFRNTESVNLYADRFSTTCRQYLESPPGKVGLVWFRSPVAPVLASGVDVGGDKLVFIPSGTVVGLVTPDLMSSESITIPTDLFNNMFAALCPSSTTTLEQLSVIEGDEKTLQILRAKLLRLLRDPAEGMHPEALSNLLAAIFSWIGNAPGSCPPEELPTQPARWRLAKRMEEFILEHYHDHVQIEDICRATGAGVRTLQRCFREYFGVTVTEFLESVRLASAHRELSVLNSSDSSVTNIALDSGFSHLGRFSTAYRQRYGITPSEQLSCRPGQKS
jgi:AraC-like DNA-binding protein